MKITITIDEGKDIDVTVNDGRDGLPMPTFKEAKEDTCKWKKVNNYTISNHHSQSLWNSENLDFCPTCGKRIEVTE